MALQGSPNKLPTMAHFTLLGLVLCFSQLTLSLAQDGNNSQSLLIREFHMQESHVHGIRVWWNVSDEYEIKEFVVIHKKLNGDFTTFSRPQYNISQEFVITDLISNTNYNVCLSIKLEDTSACPSESVLTIGCGTCINMFTIPMIRDDSLIAVIVVLGVILLLILIGCLCWHYAKKRKQSDDEETESMIGSDESKQPILLAVPPTSNGPRRSVDFEDQDIPYITPPVEDLKRERNYTNAGGTVV